MQSRRVRRVRRVRRGGGMETGRFSNRFHGGSRRSRRVRRGGGWSVRDVA